MPINAVWFKVDAESVIPSLQQALEKVHSAEGELVLDFSSVRRIDSGAVLELEKLAGAAENRAVKTVLCGVNVDIYKVLKLTKLAARFSFLN